MLVKSGIYAIRNTANSKIYVGSTINLYKRWKTHKGKLRAGKHENRYLQNAWNKYGEANFIFELLEEVDRDNLFKREGYHIDLYKSASRATGYNIRPVDESGRSYNTPETNELNRLAHTGLRHTEETKEILRKQQLGNPKSEAAKQKMRENNGRWIRTAESTAKRVNTICVKFYELTNIITGERFAGYNLAQFARDKGLTINNIYLVAKGKRKQHKGWFSTAALQQ